MIRHISSIAEIIDNMEKTVRFYRDILKLKVEYEPDSSYAIVNIPGILHFGIWSRAEAAIISMVMKTKPTEFRRD